MAATLKGSAHPWAKLTDAQVSRAKAMLRDAPRVETLARGEVNRIAQATGIERSTLLAIHYGNAWKHIAPAEIERAIA